MLPRTIDSYGGKFDDVVGVIDPTNTESSAFHNRLTEDSAQMSRCATKAWVQFRTRTSPGTVTVVAGQSQMGVGSGQLPVLARTGTGTYTITYPSTLTDALSTVEVISFLDASGSVMSTSTVGRVQCDVSGNVISVLVLSNVAGTDTASDLTGGALIRVEAR